jgi:hypothetical protein
MAQQRSTLVAVLADRREAEQAIAQLKQAGFEYEQMGVMVRDDSEVAAGGVADTYAEEGAAIGAAAGAGVGGLWALGITAGLLPPLGPVIAGGVLASVLASAAGGAAAGGAAGALIGLGVPEDEARFYESEFHGGRTVLTVKTGDRYSEALAILRQHRAYDYDSRLYGAAGRPF